MEFCNELKVIINKIANIMIETINKTTTQVATDFLTGGHVWTGHLLFIVFGGLFDSLLFVLIKIYFQEQIFVISKI